MKKFLSCLMILFCVLPCLSAFALDAPEADYSSAFTGKVFPSDKILDYYWIFYNPDSNNYRLVTSDSPMFFQYDSSSSLFVLYFTSSSSSPGFRYNSDDGLVYTSSGNFLALASSVCSLDNLSTGSFIYYTNSDIPFYREDGSLIDDFSGYTEADGKFLQYYDYYNNTNYSGLNSDGWNFGSLFGDISSLLTSGFQSITEFFSGFWSGLSDSLVSVFVPSDDFFASVSDQLEEKYNFLAAAHDILDMFDNPSSQPLSFSYTWFDGNVYSIDFTWYEPYRLSIRSLSGFLFFLLGFSKCFRMISSVFRVDSSSTHFQL